MWIGTITELCFCFQNERHQQEEQHLLSVQEERPRQAEADRDCGQTAEKSSQWHVLLEQHIHVICMCNNQMLSEPCMRPHAHVGPLNNVPFRLIGFNTPHSNHMHRIPFNIQTSESLHTLTGLMVITINHQKTQHYTVCTKHAGNPSLKT